MDKSINLLISILFVMIFWGCFNDINENQVAIKEVNEKKFYPTYKNIKEALVNPDSVYCLSLRENNLTTFPNDIRHLKNLVRLDLSMNKIDSIPFWIGELQNLKMFVMAYGNLRVIPKEIGDLTSLQSLVFLDNDIELVPNSLCKLKNIEKLNFSNNPLKELPDCLGQLDKLVYIALSNFDSTIDSNIVLELKSKLPDKVLIH